MEKPSCFKAADPQTTSSDRGDINVLKDQKALYLKCISLWEQKRVESMVLSNSGVIGEIKGAPDWTADKRRRHRTHTERSMKLHDSSY